MTGDRDEVEIWWFELRLWPFWLRVEAAVYIEQRPLRPGMKTYQCAGNDLAWWFWRLYDRVADRRRILTRHAERDDSG